MLQNELSLTLGTRAVFYVNISWMVQEARDVIGRALDGEIGESFASVIRRLSFPPSPEPLRDLTRLFWEDFANGYTQAAEGFYTTIFLQIFLSLSLWSL